MIIRIVVVLPAPFGPMKPYSAPRGIARSRSLTAFVVPKLLHTFWSRIASGIAVESTARRRPGGAICSTYSRAMLPLGTAAGVVLLASSAAAQVTLSGESGAAACTRISPSAAQGRSSATTPACRSPTARGLRADSWDASRLTLREHQCKVHNGALHLPRAAAGPHLGRERSADAAAHRDQDLHQHLRAGRGRSGWTAVRIRRNTRRTRGRASRPASGEGDILTVYTTHIKQEWIRRNGVPNSEKSTMIEHFIRHGNIMTHLVQWTDPVYLTEPLHAQRRFRAERAARAATGCGRANTSTRSSTGRTATCRITCRAGARSTASSRTATAFRSKRRRGGAETTYPEYHGEAADAAETRQAVTTSPAAAAK